MLDHVLRIEAVVLGLAHLFKGHLDTTPATGNWLFTWKRPDTRDQQLLEKSRWPLKSPCICVNYHNNVFSPQWFGFMLCVECHNINTTSSSTNIYSEGNRGLHKNKLSTSITQKSRFQFLCKYRISHRSHLSEVWGETDDLWSQRQLQKAISGSRLEKTLNKAERLLYRSWSLDVDATFNTQYNLGVTAMNPEKVKEKHWEQRLTVTCEIYFFSLKILAAVSQLKSLAFNKTLDQKLPKWLPEREGEMQLMSAFQCSFGWSPCYCTCERPDPDPCRSG